MTKWNNLMGGLFGLFLENAKDGRRPIGWTFFAWLRYQGLLAEGASFWSAELGLSGRE